MEGTGKKGEKTTIMMLKRQSEDEEKNDEVDLVVEEEFDPFDQMYSLEDLDIPELTYKRKKSWSEMYILSASDDDEEMRSVKSQGMYCVLCQLSRVSTLTLFILQ